MFRDEKLIWMIKKSRGLVFSWAMPLWRCRAFYSFSQTPIRRSGSFEVYPSSYSQSRLPYLLGNTSCNLCFPVTLGIYSSVWSRWLCQSRAIAHWFGAFDGGPAYCSPSQRGITSSTLCVACIQCFQDTRRANPMKTTSNQEVETIWKLLVDSLYSISP